MKKEAFQVAPEVKVKRFIQQHELVSRRSPLLVAVSGGPDSVCLLNILHNLREVLGITIHVAHLNHQLRGADAEADECYVAEFAHQMGINAVIESRDVKTYQRSQGLSLEEAAREVRYEFLAQVAHSIGTSQVAVGHTLDDHVETIVMHLIRGTGSRGLRGLQPKVDIRYSGHTITIIRPLLSITRDETDSYCQQYRLAPRVDASNQSLSPLRNRIRLELLPLLTEYNPRFAEALVRTARIVGDDSAFLEEEAARLLESIVQWGDTTVVLQKREFLTISPVLQRYVLRAVIEKLLGNLMDVEAQHIEEIIAALRKPAGKKLNLPRDVVFSIEYDSYSLSLGEPALSPFPPLDGEFPLNIPGETSIPGWRITASIVEGEAMRGLTQKGEDNQFSACFDLDAVGDTLTVRTRRRSDRFHPLGLGQPKKLGEFMIDAKIPRLWRSRIPLVCSSAHIVWLVGWRIDERAKVTMKSRSALCITAENVKE